MINNLSHECHINGCCYRNRDTISVDGEPLKRSQTFLKPIHLVPDHGMTPLTRRSEGNVRWHAKVEVLPVQGDDILTNEELWQ